MNYCEMPYNQKNKKDLREFQEIEKLIKHSMYSTNLSKYYKLKKELKNLEKNLLAYGIPQELLNNF